VYVALHLCFQKDSLNEHAMHGMHDVLPHLKNWGVLLKQGGVGLDKTQIDTVANWPYSTMCTVQYVRPRTVEMHRERLRSDVFRYWPSARQDV